MQSTCTRLDRFVSEKTGVNRRDVRLMLARGRLLVDGQPAVAINQPIYQFSQVLLDGEVLQDKQAVYLMLHKPVGVVSATKDDKNSTVIDLLTHADRQKLHIVGRLDFNTSGLLLLTNDGRWSRALTQPEHKIPKCYHVTVENPITDDYVQAFAAGMYFSYEGLTTLPAELKIISPYVAQLCLFEGRYHQVKRMFGRFDNKVLSLHRLSIGSLALDSALQPGQSRQLRREELEQLACPFNWPR